MFWHYLVVIITPAAKFKCSLGYYELPTFIEEVCQGIELYLYFGLFIIVTAQELYVLCLKVNIYSHPTIAAIQFAFSPSWIRKHYGVRLTSVLEQREETERFCSCPALAELLW